MRFRARVFGAGLPAAGTPVEVEIDALQLSILDERPRRVPLSQLSLRAAGFNDRQWELSWNDAGGPRALMLEDPAAIAALRSSAPPPLAAAIAALDRQARRGRGLRALAISAVGLWLLLPLLALVALIAAAGPIGGWIAGHVPIEHERRLGDWAFEAMRRQLELVQGTTANDALETIGAKLTAGSAYDYRWYIARDASLNAFAVPGGIVVVYTGLIRAADSAEALAGVLAHEIEHVERRHSLKAMVHQAGLRVALAAVVGDVGIAGEAAGRLAGLRFSRDNEREADLLALRRLERAGIDSGGMLRIFEKLGAGGAAAPAWLSTHPGSEERLARLRAHIGQARAAPPLPIDWAQVQASLESP